MHEDADSNDIADRLGAYTLSRLPGLLQDEQTSAYEHPYGFTVVRLHRELITGWQIRIHLWPPRELQEARLKRNGATDQQVHSHGWRIWSIVLLGRLVERSFEIAEDEASIYGSYTVVSDYATGFSRLELQQPYVTPMEEQRRIRTPSSEGYFIPTGALHASSSEGEIWSLSLVATELSHNVRSRVVAPMALGRTVLNERRATSDMHRLRSLLS
jgi:hypothetical protein